MYHFLNKEKDESPFFNEKATRTFQLSTNVTKEIESVTSKKKTTESDEKITKIANLRMDVLAKHEKLGIRLRQDKQFGGSEALDKLQEKFMKRKNEIKDFINIVDKIKAYIKEHKKDLLKQKGEDEYNIYEIKKANRPERTMSNLSRRSSSSNFLKK